MNNLAYDSLHKFFVSAGAALVITPIVGFYFLLQGEVQLISQEEYENLSAYSQHCIDFKEYLLFIIQKAGIFVAIFVMLIGIFLLLLGIHGWKNNQKELDKQLALTTQEVLRKLQSYNEDDKNAKAKELKEEKEQAESFSSSDVAEKTEHHLKSDSDKMSEKRMECASFKMSEECLQSDMFMPNNTHSNYQEVEKDFYESGIYKLLPDKEYIIKQEKKINGNRFDGLAISKANSNDFIFEIKWWLDYKNKYALEHACKRLKNSESVYTEATNRKCEAILVIITGHDTVPEMKDWLKKVSNEIDTHGIRIEVMADELLA